MVKRLTEKTDITQAYKLLKELRTDLDYEEYLDLYQNMQKNGYELFAYIDQHEMKALAGVSIQTNFYNKKHLYIYDLVTKKTDRSKGYGAKLISYLCEYSKEQGCQYIALESGIQRLDAHRFYEEKMNFDKFCYSFRLKLDFE